MDNLIGEFNLLSDSFRVFDSLEDITISFGAFRESVAEATSPLDIIRDAVGLLSDIFGFLGIDLMSIIDLFAGGFGIDGIIATAVDSAVNSIISSFGNAREGMERFVDDITGNVIDFVSNITEGFDNLQTSVTEGWNSFWEGVQGFTRTGANSVIGTVNRMIQGVTNGVNSVIGAFNSIGFDMPAWMGGGSFRPNIPKIPSVQIPMLARGGIVDRPTLALIGERGKEAVMPLENNTGWITDLANSIGAVVGSQLAFNQSAMHSSYSALDSDRPINLYLDGRKVAEGIMDDFVEVAKWRDIQLSPVFG